jgi:uncharacterized repeat protein (TIGR01451 family)
MKKIFFTAILFIAVSFCVPSISFGTQCHVGISHTILSQDSTSCTVQFSDTSMYPDSYHYNLWNFGDGTTSSSVTNPIHTYLLGNSYLACLTIYDSLWAICDSSCLMIDLSPGPACTAGYWYNSNHMIFSFYDGSLNPATWSWDFGDGSTSTLPNPIHTYSLEGYYNVCLEISDGAGTCTDSYCNTIWTTCFYDTTFHYSASGTEVHFTGPDSSDVSIIYTWNFGDGSSITANNPVHTYASGGDYFVCLYIDDTSGVCSDTICKNVHVNCVDPSFSYQHVCPPKYTYSFSDNTVGNISSRLWDFGDGQTDTIQNPIHTYLTCGYYPVCLTVTTDSNCTMQKCSNLYVQCCEVNFTYYYSGAAVVFDNDSSFCDFFYNGYHWDFGDGNSMNQNYYDPYVQHIYLTPGIYTVCLSNIDTSGFSCCTDTLCQNVAIMTGDTCADLSVDVGGSIRPQIQTQIIIQYCNYGNIPANNTSLSLDLNPLVNPVSANPQWSSQTGNTLTWNLNSVPAGPCSTIYLNVIGDASLQAGTVLCSNAHIHSSTEDCDTINNSLQECMNVINSFDPNDKFVAAKQFEQKGYVENDTIFPSDKLDYIIHFQNTGTAPAVNIFIYDTLDSHVNPSTVLPGACSYPYTYFEIIGNVLKWSFWGINLPDSVNNEAESHGFIKFSVSQNPGNALGISIKNNAGIVFDFNEAVITNDAVVVIDSTTSIVELTENFSFSYFPNPVVDDLFLMFSDNIHSVKCEITDMTGKMVYSMDAENAASNQGTLKLSLKHLSAGTYNLTVIDLQTEKQASVLVIKKQ